MSHDGGVEVRRGLGTFGDWPDAPDSTDAPVIGPALALLGPDFEGPRTMRTSFGITRALGSRAALHLSMNYRHTDFLPRRHDLNRYGQGY